MPVDPAITADNDAQRKRLEALTVRTDGLNKDLGGGWTVGVALAHLAFWDRRASILLRRWQEHGAPPDDPDDDVINESLLVEWRILPAQEAAELAVQAARAVDAAVNSLDDKTIAAILDRGDRWLLHRGNHRREHLDQIEQNRL